MNQITALVPMKGHSERMPNKNMAIFNTQPLCYWILKTLEKAKRVKSVCINTDSGEIAAYIEMNFPKIKIIQRPQEICGDFVSMNEIINYDLSQIEEDVFLQTHSTNPLLTPETIDEAIDTYFNQLDKFDGLYSVTPYFSRFFDDSGKAINHNPEELLRTQDIKPIYEENSNIYIFSKTSFRNNNKNRIGINPYLYEMERREVSDIDDANDFYLAMLVHAQTQGENKE